MVQSGCRPRRFGRVKSNLYEGGETTHAHLTATFDAAA
jgi:hypothetical protein